jgi:hypothetical protein
MSLSHCIAVDPPGSRRWRRCVPLLVVLGLTALALSPGMISGDRSFEINLCGDREGGGLQACAQQWRAALAERNLVR